MNILLTGAGGFLGKHIAYELKENKFDVTSLARNHYVDLDKLGIKTLKYDLKKKEDLDLSDFDVVIHCAALAGVWGKKEDFFKTNFEGSVHLFNCAKRDGVKHFIYTSTPSVVFGRESIEWGDETLPYPKKFYTEYAKSKAMAEEYILSNSSDSMQSIAIRPHLIWGKGDPHIIPRLLQKARSGNLRIVGDGENMVDVIHVKNAAHAHVLALKALLEGKKIGGRPYFIGQERPVKLWDFINQILNQYDIDPLTIENSLSFKSAYMLGSFFESLYKPLGIKKPEPPITRFVALQFAKSHYFNHTNAQNDFSYFPTVSIEEGLAELRVARESVINS